MDDFYCPTCRAAPLITDYCPACSRIPTPGVDAWVKGLPEYDADREKVSLRLKVRHLLDVLESIANADPRKREPDMRDQFQQWAQNRARHTIEKVGAGDTATEGHNAEVSRSAPLLAQVGSTDGLERG